MANIKTKIKKESKSINQQIRQQSLSYITAGFGLVAGLAWNDAIKAFIEYIFPLKEKSLQAKFIYAILMTLVVALITMYLTRVLKGEEKE